MFGIEFVAGQFVKATLKSAANQLLSDQVAKTVKRHAWCASLAFFYWCSMAHVYKDL